MGARYLPSWEVREAEPGFHLLLASFLLLLVLFYVRIFKNVSLSLPNRYGGNYFFPR